MFEFHVNDENLCRRDRFELDRLLTVSLASVTETWKNPLRFETLEKETKE